MELIKDRIAHIIRSKNLTATQFAEMMQIQPSNVSHLLSGRNKPSLDFLIKLKDIFPEYSFDWIILGKKPITMSERQQSVKEEMLHDNVQFAAIESTALKIGNFLGTTEETDRTS
jgi:plasmid maintenance system antidote protein VapI